MSTATVETGVTITMDGVVGEFPKGTLLIEAAVQLGIEIPVYCYHPKMDPVGACRVCVVEVENQRRPIMTACTTTVMEGMVVHTQSAAAKKAREGVLEFLLINHPLDCPVCDRAGECDLQDFVLRHGPGTSRFKEKKRHFEKAKQIGDNIILDRERCIMCQRCVRFSHEIARDSDALAIVDRGTHSEIGTGSEAPYNSPFGGNVVELCPVGALTAKAYRFKSRPWELQHFSTVCHGCSVGCNTTTDVRYDEVVRTRSRMNEQVDDGWLCDKGRYHDLNRRVEDRVTQPLRKTEDGYQEISWDEALSFYSEKTKGINLKKSLVVVDNNVDNESGYAAVRLARSVYQTSNIHLVQPYLDRVEDLRGVSKSFVESAEVLVVDSVSLANLAPVVELWLNKALKQGAQLITIGDAPKNLSCKPHAAIKDKEQAQLLETLKQPVASDKKTMWPIVYPWESGFETSNDIAVAQSLLSGASKVCWLMEAEKEDPGPELFTDLDDTLGRTVLALRLTQGANTLGLLEMGCHPYYGPGGTDLEKLDNLSQAWDGYNSEEGCTPDELEGKKFDCVLEVGSCSQQSKVGKNGFYLVLTSSFNPETPKTNQAPDLILPMAHQLEHAHTTVNLSGYLQYSGMATVPVGESLSGWMILTRLAEVHESLWGWSNHQDVILSMGKNISSLEGLSLEDFSDQSSRHWSYPQGGALGAPRPDLSAIPSASGNTPYLNLPSFTSQVGKTGRLTYGDSVPTVPGQEDPRALAQKLGFNMSSEEGGEEKNSDLLNLRVIQSGPIQPAGPSPAHRYHKVGVQAFEPASQWDEPEVEPTLKESEKGDS